MATYAIEYDLCLGLSCCGGGVSERIEEEVELSDEEVKALLDHLSKYDLSELLDFEYHEIDELLLSGEAVELDVHLPELYDKIWTENLSAYCKLNLNEDLMAKAMLPNSLVLRAWLAQKKSNLFYHGSGVRFEHFDLAHALEGDGKCKFGFGVYLTSEFKSAAHYSASNPDWNDHYVYTVVVPEVTDANSIHFQRPVPAAVVEKASEALGEPIKDKYILNGKDFRKYIASVLYKRISKAAKAEGRPEPSKIEGEKAASAVLLKVGVEYIVWPYNWRNPDGGINIAVLDSEKINILRCHRVILNDKKKLVAKWKA